LRASEDKSNESEVFMGAVNGGNKPWNASVKVNNVSVEFKVDTGADVTVSSKQLYDKKCSHIPLRTTKTPKLYGPDSKPLNTIGYMQCQMSGNHIEISENIYVLAQARIPLLSRNACELLHIIKFLGEVSAESVVQEFPSLFKGLSKIHQPCEIKLDENVRPYSVPTPHRVPLPLMSKVKSQLEKLESQGVIKQVVEPTDWCAPMVVVPKADGEVRICVDLKCLNKAVKRETHVTISSVCIWPDVKSESILED